MGILKPRTEDGKEAIMHYKISIYNLTSINAYLL
jgi:hypothetical protein